MDDERTALAQKTEPTDNILETIFVSVVRIDENDIEGRLCR